MNSFTSFSSRIFRSDTEKERHPAQFGYLFAVYILAGAGEVLISPMFPLIRDELGLVSADQAALMAILGISMGIANLVGGYIGFRHSDRLAMRISVAMIAIGSLICGVSQSFLHLAVGQAVLGAGVGLSFGPALALIGRMYTRTRGRAIANYGLAYALGLAAGAFSANLGAELWRAAFVATGVAAVLLTFVVPSLPDGDVVANRKIKLWTEARTNFARPEYQLAVICGIVAGSNHYVIIGLAPEHFESAGLQLALITSLIGIGRFISMLGKVVAGRSFDRFGGRRTIQGLLVCTLVFGLFELGLPPQLGVWLVVPFVTVTAMLFPVANAVVVSSLPTQSTWGVGVFRAILVLSAGLCSALVSVALNVVTTQVVMLACLVLTGVALALTAAPLYSHVGGPLAPRTVTRVVSP